MEVIYSDHAKQRMREKGITELEIEHVLLHSSEVKNSYGYAKEAIGIVNNRQIRVIISGTQNYLKIVTVM